MEGAKAEAVVAVAMMAATTFMVSFEQLVHVAGRWFVEAPGSSDSSYGAEFCSSRSSTACNTSRIYDSGTRIFSYLLLYG